MTHFEIWILAIGLAMDCFAVSITSGIILKKMEWRTVLLMAFFFGFFQALNPFIGWLATSHFSHFIESFDHWLAFILLGFIGGKMVFESLKKDDDEEFHCCFNPRKLKVITVLAVATSIDALAVGISFACIGMNKIEHIVYPLWSIGIVSFIMSIIGSYIGVRFGKKYAQNIKADFWGGLILIGIGLKILCEHLFS